MKHAFTPLFPAGLRAILALVATLGANAAHAQAFESVRLNRAAPGQDGGLVGAVALFGTEYAGSDERRTMVLPVIDYQWANGWFAGVTNGIGVNFSDVQGMQYGVRLTADFGRKENRSNRLLGMGDVDAKVEFGGFFNYALTPAFSLVSSLRYGSGDGSGVVLDLGANYALPIDAQWRLGVGSGISVVNAEHMQSYFGVTATQATASGYAAYSPQGGVRNIRANAALTYLVSPRVSLTAGVSVNSLLGDAADSPLVQKKTSVNGLFAAAYAF